MGNKCSGGAFPLIAASAILVSTFATGPVAALAAEAGDLEIPVAKDERVALATESSPMSPMAGSEGAIAGDGWALGEDGVLTIEKDIPKPSNLRYEWGRYAGRVREVRLEYSIGLAP